MWSPTHVQIIVQRARNIVAKGRNGTNDSYVIIQNGKEKFQTSVKEQSIDPVWHEECDLLIDDKNTDIIKLVVFHRNLFGLADEFLGQAFVPLQDFDIYERPKSRWCELEGRTIKSTNKYRGEIEIRVTFIVKNIPKHLDKHKKRNSLVHQSLLDIRSALKSSDAKADKHESKVSAIPGRKFSVSDHLARGPKQASRSISFKLDALNSRRKSLVDKFLRRHDDIHHSPDIGEEYDVEEEETPKTNDINGVINEEISQSEEDVRLMGRNSDNKIVIEVKNEINSECDIIVDEINCVKVDHKLNDDNNVSISDGFEETTDKKDDKLSETKCDSNDSKSMSWMPLKTSLKKALSTGHLFHLGQTTGTVSSKTPSPPKLSRERSCTSTGGSDDNNILAEVLPQIRRQNHVCNNKTSSEAVLRQLYNRDKKERLLTVLEKSDRRHTIDLDQLLSSLNLTGVDKRSTQASPDSLYSSFESLIIRKQTKTDYHLKYDGLNKEELIQLIESQQMTILGLNEQINDLEKYIDNLLVRVIETSPRILQNSHFNNNNRFKNLYKV